MTLKYFGTATEGGLNLSVSLFDSEGNPIHENFPMVETGVESCIYRTSNIFDIIDYMNAGIYVTRVKDEDSGEFLGFGEIIFNGVKEITLLELKFLTEKEMMQLRDAIGIDGDKMVARNGQLQKKSEYPHNSIIDTNEI